MAIQSKCRIIANNLSESVLCLCMCVCVCVCVCVYVCVCVHIHTCTYTDRAARNLVIIVLSQDEYDTLVVAECEAKPRMSVNNKDTI